VWENPKFCRTSPIRRQSEARNFKTAQHINKQMTDVSSMINALKYDGKLGGITPWGFDAT